jgi:signal transduction histidine kinase
VRDADGAVVSVLAAGRDISERKRHERAIERQNERLEEFASVVSHDLRNPLNVASGQLRLARKRREPEHLDAVANALDRMIEIVDDVLTMARASQTVDSAEPVSLSAVATESWETVATESAELRVESDRTLAADPGRLRHVFENLFGNSVEHGGSSVRVTVGATDEGFFVADDGPGIPADERENVFGPGYSTAEAGTGLGLNIVGQMVESHGWEIRVADGDGGARFEVTGVEST